MTTWADPLYPMLAILLGLLFALLVILAAYLFPGFRQALIGVSASPRVVGLVRLAIFQVGPSAILWLNGWIAGWDDPRLIALQPLLNIAMRQVEAEFDRRFKPRQNEVNPPPVAGGGIPDLLI